MSSFSTIDLAHPGIHQPISAFNNVVPGPLESDSRTKTQAVSPGAAIPKTRDRARCISHKCSGGFHKRVTITFLLAFQDGPYLDTILCRPCVSANLRNNYVSGLQRFTEYSNQEV